MPTLKVLTINLRGYRANWAIRRARLLRVIEEEQIDVVLLQEVVDRTWHIDQARELARLIDYHVEYHPAQLFVPWPAVSSGLAILSRYPFVEGSVIELVPRSGFWPNGRNQRRILQRAEINLDGLRLAVFNTHLPLSRENRAIACQGIWSEVAIEKAPFAVVGGDFNALPDEENIRYLRGEQEKDGIVGALTDSWIIAGSGTGATYPSVTPKARIDYLFYMATKSVTVLSAQVVGLAPDIFSDHAGVLTTFQIIPAEEMLFEEEEEPDPYKYHGKGDEILGTNSFA